MSESAASALRRLRPFRRLHGLCLYCGRQIYSHRRLACIEHRDLLLVDPLVNRAHLPLTERERISASRDPLVSKARQPLSEQERMAAG